MDIDKYIAELTKLRQAHGPGLKVMQLAPASMGMHAATLPRIGHTKKDQPRVLFSKGSDLDRNRGEMVVVLGIGDAKAREQRKATKEEESRFVAMEGYNKRLGRGRV